MQEYHHSYIINTNIKIIIPKNPARNKACQKALYSFFTVQLNGPYSLAYQGSKKVTNSQVALHYKAIRKTDIPWTILLQ